MQEERGVERKWKKTKRKVRILYKYIEKRTDNDLGIKIGNSIDSLN